MLSFSCLHIDKVNLPCGNIVKAGNTVARAGRLEPSGGSFPRTLAALSSLDGDFAPLPLCPTVSGRTAKTLQHQVLL